jgi:hypothetical protein
MFHAGQDVYAMELQITVPCSVSNLLECRFCAGSRTPVLLFPVSMFTE